jgi:large subunit ribosomal protein L29
MKAAELREMPDDELLARLEGLKEELFNLRFQSATGQLDSPMRIKDVRHDAARVLTVLRERQTEEELRLAVEAADRRSLEERREAIASGELQGTSLADAAAAGPDDELEEPLDGEDAGTEEPVDADASAEDGSDSEEEA